ncbi:MAG: glutamate ligase domain-containing protein, partial [Nitrospinota bacterium]
GRALTGVREEELLEELLTLSGARRAELEVVTLSPREECLGPLGSAFALEGEGVHIEDLSLAMAGRHQLENAALAAQAALMLGLGEGAIREGLKGAKLPGRGELMGGPPRVLLDGAHNRDKAAALAETLPLYQAGRRLFLLAMVHNKDAEAFVEVLAPFMDEALVTVPGVTHRLACPPERLVRALKDCGVSSRVNLDPQDALQELMTRAGPGDLICATGSLFLVGQLRKRWVSEEAMLGAGTAFPGE